MPLYIISHYTPLTSQQKDALAAVITTTHTSLFITPSIFVNVRFQDINSTPYYVGGQQKLTNNIIAHVRPGPSRPRSVYNALCSEIKDVWSDIVPSEKLDTIFIMGDIIAGYEQGFMLPEAGNDGAWIRENMKEFEKRAQGGDETMVGMVKEIKERGLDKE